MIIIFRSSNAFLWFFYPTIDFKTFCIPTVKNCVSRSREDDFIPHPASNSFVSRVPSRFQAPSRTPLSLCWTLKKALWYMASTIETTLLERQRRPWRFMPIKCQLTSALWNGTFVHSKTFNFIFAIWIIHLFVWFRIRDLGSVSGFRIPDSGFLLFHTPEHRQLRWLGRRLSLSEGYEAFCGRKNATMQMEDSL